MPQLDELAQLIKACDRCDLHKTRGQSVPGDGPQDAEVMFIGEAPGFYEDQQGRPFVGAAGKFLDSLLELAGLNRPEVFITNIVKSRPPNNRDPLPAELEACRPWLEQQIEIIDPKVVVTLGRYSMAYFFPGEMINRIHGQPKSVGDRLVVPMYHPAAALHQERFRQLIENDFRRLRLTLNQRQEQLAEQAREEEKPQQMRLL